MQTQTEVRILLKAERGMFQCNGFRSLRTFNFADYQKEGRTLPGALLAFNDDTLAPDATHIIAADEPCEIILIPIAGAIELTVQDAQYIDSGQAVRFWAAPGKSYPVTNPYARESVNYLQIRFAAEDWTGKIETDAFEVLQRNVLSCLFSESRHRLAIGIFGGREEGIYLPQNAMHYTFAFVIEGAFEMQNRLLERRDGLLLQNAESIDFEALSNEAVLLVLEILG